MLKYLSLIFFIVLLAGHSQASSNENENFHQKKLIPIEFAAWEKTTHDANSLQVQGSERNPLKNYCGSMGTFCTCEVSLHGTSQKGLFPVSYLSELYNFATCAIPLGVDDAKFSTVRLLGKKKKVISKTVPIQSEITLHQILGDLNKAKVRKIFRYSCTSSFLEGEFVNSVSVACGSGQHLGLIYADYDFYLYQSQIDNNFTLKGGDSGWPNVCNFPLIPLQTDCGNSTPVLRYGFYSEAAGPFTTAVTMAASRTISSSLYGFVASVDSSGRCPLGLVKIRPAVAQPTSMNIPHSCVNSNFVNTSGSLNNTIVEELEVIQAKRFSVKRQPSLGFQECIDDIRNENSATMCRTTATTSLGIGDCSKLQLDAVYEAQNIGYHALTPTVCAIPKSLVEGI